MTTLVPVDQSKDADIQREMLDVAHDSRRMRDYIADGSVKKYHQFAQIDLPNRQWPSCVITKAPIWCSVDLRDGNQALAIPMSVDEKVKMFQLLVDIGFKEIEVGFPSASPTEFNFMRRLVDENLIPDDVTVQVLVQAREALIRRTFESLQGIKSAIVHLYNSTSELQRRVVFGMDKQQIIDIAVNGTELVKSLVPTLPDTNIRFQYSPESFSATELKFALEICEAVVDVWQPTPERKMILNLPATVEMSTPNLHADQIEWFCTKIRQRDSVLISLHTHNDRGTGVAATELGLLAGADRVEGTLFGNGERTGNVDIVTLALNLYTQGVDPKLDFSDIHAVREVYEKVTRMRVHERHPYGGELVFTAFSGSHQDAIRKGMSARKEAQQELWEVPYLPIDPQDVGCTYEAIIRVNSQSGKGGVAYLLESEYELRMPKGMHPEFGRVINEIADQTGEEMTAQQIYETFVQTYFESASPFELVTFRVTPSIDSDDEVTCFATIKIDGTEHQLSATGNGPINSFMKAMKEELVPDFKFISYAEHSVGRGSAARAVAYIEIETPSGAHFFGAGTHHNTSIASIKALLGAINRAYKSK